MQSLTAPAQRGPRLTDHILLAQSERAALQSAVSNVVEAAGGIELDFVTRLCMARRCRSHCQA
jgi:hypothetical protein